MKISLLLSCVLILVFCQEQASGEKIKDASLNTQLGAKGMGYHPHTHKNFGFKADGKTKWESKIIGHSMTEEKAMDGKNKAYSYQTGTANDKENNLQNNAKYLGTSNSAGSDTGSSIDSHHYVSPADLRKMYDAISNNQPVGRP